MSHLDYGLKSPPTGIRKLLYLNWPLIVLLAAVSSVGFLMLYSVAGGRIEVWAEPQMTRFAAGMAAMLIIAMVPIWFWRNLSALAYVFALILLIAVEFFGDVGMGAQRWLEIGPLRLQPSEVMKIALVMALAAYYDWLDLERTSRLVWVILPVLLILVPTALVLSQPDLGTSLMLVMGGGIIMFAAGVSLWYFGTVLAIGIAGIWAVLLSRGTSWQLLRDYQYRRIDVFLDPCQPTRSARATTSRKPKLHSARAAGRGAASCKARSRG